jgi:hypothetical protein
MYVSQMQFACANKSQWIHCLSLKGAVALRFICRLIAPIPSYWSGSPPNQVWSMEPCDDRLYCESGAFRNLAPQLLGEKTCQLSQLLYEQEFNTVQKLDTASSHFSLKANDEPLAIAMNSHVIVLTRRCRGWWLRCSDLFVLL